MKTRIFSFILCVSILLGLCSCGGTDSSGKVINESLDFEPITSEGDSLLRYNPDRAWRLEAYCNISNKTADGQAIQGDPSVNVKRNVQKYAEFSPQLCQTYFYLTGHKNEKTLPDEVFDRIQTVFDTAKDLGIKLLVRFAYQGDMQGTGEASDEVMLAHMEQLKPILKKNVKVIHTVEAGFLGAWGEWHSYQMEHDREKLLRAIVDMTPEELFVQVRYPGIKNMLIQTDPIYKRIGYHDDSFFGYRYCSSASSLNPGMPDWNQIIRESSRVPIGGETFWGYEHSEMIDGYDSILQFSAFRQNSFSIYHSFIEDGVGKGYAMEDWQKEYVNEGWLSKNNIIYTPNYFLDKDGNKVKRTVFEFVSDYMGYKLEARHANIVGTLEKSGTIGVELDLVNYGFSAAFNMFSGFAVLDENYKVVTTVDAGDPSTWNSRNARDYSDGTLLIHKIAANVKLPEKSGKYKLAFWVKNSAGTGARLGNNLDYTNGYTILYDFEI